MYKIKAFFRVSGRNSHIIMNLAERLGCQVAQVAMHHNCWHF